MPRKPTEFTEAQDAILRREWPNPKVSMSDIADMVEMPRTQVRYRAQTLLGLGPKVTEQGEYGAELRENLAKLWADRSLSTQAIGERLNIPRNTVISIAHRMKLTPKVFSWTPEKIATLTRLWGDGRSASEIGLELDVSASTVRGKALRMGLPRRDAATSANNLKRRTPGNRAKPKLMIVGNGAVLEKPEGQPSPFPPVRQSAWAPLPGVQPVLFLKRTDKHCAWPIDSEDGSLLCCGAVATDGSYCRTHHRRSSAPVQPKKVRAPEDPSVVRIRRAA
jgi:GcrA cell cycle regulator